MTLLTLLLILSPIRLIPPMDLPVVSVCAALELASPNDTLGLWTARKRWRELRYAPPLAASSELPEHDLCCQMEVFWCRRIRYIETQRSLFGSYRWGDADQALEQAQVARRHWAMARKATDESEWLVERRRALAWLCR